MDKTLYDALAKYAAELEKFSAEYEAEMARKEFPIELANAGDVDAILKLKEFAAEGNVDAQNALEKLYWDGKKEHAVGTVVLRDVRTAIGNEEFKECKKLEKIILPDGLTSIGRKAFFGCTALTKVNFPNSLTFIGKSAFEGCESLDGVSLPENLYAVGERAFWNCGGNIKFGKNFDVRAIGSIFGDKWRWLEEMMFD